MMARRGVMGVLAGAAAAVLGGCGMMGHTYRYKLTVEVETPDGLRTGYAVREVSWSPGVQITAEADTASMIHRGEAAMVDLPNGQVLFALMSPDGQETPMLAFGSARQTAWSDDSVKVLQPPAKIEAAYGQSGYPRLVRFRDIAEPETVEKVDPANLAASFGPGYRLKRITAQIVSEDVTEKVAEKLPWLGKYSNGRLLSGQEGGMSLGDMQKNGLSAELGASYFSWGIGK